LISAFGLVALAGILPECSTRASAEFQNHRIDLRRNHAGRKFSLFFHNRPAGSYDFEVALLFFFSTDDVPRQISRVCDTMSRANDGLHVDRVAFTCFGFSISPPKFFI